MGNIGSNIQEQNRGVCAVVQSSVASRTGGALLADSLIALGADTVYCVPGESFLPFLDAVHDRTDALRLVVCRQEGGASYMADAHAKMTGKPGVCFVTRGPGACNAAIGVHTAFQDCTPMLLFIGQVDRPMIGREAFQEVDMTAFFAPLAKFSATADSAARLPELVARAWAAATSGRPGPAVVALPEDVLAEMAFARDPLPRPPARPAPRAADMTDLATRLAAAERPLVIVGGGTWTPRAAKLVTTWAEASGLPVVAAFRRQDVVDNLSPVYIGELGFSASPRLNARIKAADLIVCVGDRLGEVTTQGYSLIESPVPSQSLIHIFPDAGEIGRVYATDLGIVSAMEPFAEMLSPVDGRHWAGWLAQGRADYAANLRADPCPGAVDMAQVMAEIEARLPEDAVITNGAGNYSGWVHRFHRYRHFPSQLAPGNGSMGYGLPAAIAAKVVAPRRVVVAFAGDGCFLMNGQELATAVDQGLDPIIIVINNGMYGTIRMHQEKAYPGRVSGTSLTNPDFVALAQAYGALGLRVRRTAEFGPAFDQALAAGRPVLIEIHQDPEAISHRVSLTALREKALATSA
ncbi:thiamine pyrophosphate-binding protein [Rhodospirillum rubrum]|uniref:thiamine pyrophosphate-binding protein n=1 Tax=Rhodospirillum rubrum TaxID=1085 RepID=UPI001903BDD8|nr:thiamine pyrophosphate-binding protein [Rhodospirillum rubrum]MBK1665665.1 thiamine pyrophosphate-binding protein [Rhodospirillum rubrum]MBK1677742.1 thiamine pyrophosphate-binding protein [Rhodospirillum rubrum]